MWFIFCLLVYLEESYVLSKYLGLYLSVINVCFNSILVWENSLSDFNPPKFIETCLMSQNMVYLGKYFVCALEKNVFCCCWIEYSINISLIKLVDSVVHVFYILIPFLFIGCMNYFREQCWNFLLELWICIFFHFLYF